MQVSRDTKTRFYFIVKAARTGLIMQNAELIQAHFANSDLLNNSLQGFLNRKSLSEWLRFNVGYPLHKSNLMVAEVLFTLLVGIKQV